MLPVLLAARNVKRGFTFARVVRRLAWAVPFFAIAVGTFLTRLAVLRTMGGSREADPGSFDTYQYGIFAGSFVRDLLFPFAGLAPATHHMWLQVTIALLIGLGLVLFLPRGFAALALAGALWVIGFVVLCALFKIATMGWLAYFSLVGLALLIAAGIEGGLQRPDVATAGGLRFLSYGTRFVLLVGLAVFGLSSMWASPLVRGYDQWSVAGQLTDRYFAALRECAGSSPDVGNVNLEQVPGSLDDGRVDTSLLGVTLIEQYTADSALRAMFPTRNLRVHVGSRATFTGNLDKLDFSCERRPNGVELLARHNA
jgi:hypothetical protein